MTDVTDGPLVPLASPQFVGVRILDLHTGRLYQQVNQTDAREIPIADGIDGGWARTARWVTAARALQYYPDDKPSEAQSSNDLISMLTRKHTETITDRIDQMVTDYFGGDQSNAIREIEANPNKYVLIDTSPELELLDADTSSLRVTQSTWFGTKADAIKLGLLKE